MQKSSTANTFEVLKWDGRSLGWQPDELSEEAPLEIRILHRPVTVTMRTPGHDVELAAGFLLSEGIVTDSSDLLGIRHCIHDPTRSTLNVTPAPHVDFDPQRLTRHVFASSSCGLCGKATIDAVRNLFPPVRSTTLFRAEAVAQMPTQMRNGQTAFSRTGGLHAAAVFDAYGRLVVLREDVGRHNAVDKVLGHCLLHDLLPLSGHVLLVSGRCSFEIMQKALSAQLPVVAAVSAPSSLALEFARESEQTLIGFLRNLRMNVYTRPDRLAFPPNSDREGAYDRDP